MIKLKKLALGTITTIAATAPIVVAVSCEDSGSTKPKSSLGVSVNLRKDLDNESIGSQLQLLPLDEQDLNFTNYLTELSSDGKKEMKKFTKDTLKQAIATANPTGKTIMFKVTIADKAKRIINERVQKDIKQIQKLKKDIFTDVNNKTLTVEMGGVSSKLGFESNFFEKIINSENTKDEMSLLSQAINDLEKEQATDFRIVMQLVLPKWLEEFKSVSLTFGNIFDDMDNGKNGSEYTVDQIQSVINQKNANVNLVDLDVETRIKTFNPSNLPTGITKLDLSDNRLTTFDATNLPTGITKLNLSDNQLTTFDATNLPTGITKLDLSDNQFTTFDPSNLPSGITEIDLARNHLKTFNPSNLPSGITKLDLTYNQLTSFDTTNLPTGITKLVLSGNQLTTFDVTNLPSSIEELWLRWNNFPQSVEDSIKSQLKNTGIQVSI